MTEVQYAMRTEGLDDEHPNSHQNSCSLHRKTIKTWLLRLACCMCHLSPTDCCVLCTQKTSALSRTCVRIAAKGLVPNDIFFQFNAVYSGRLNHTSHGHTYKLQSKLWQFFVLCEGCLFEAQRTRHWSTRNVNVYENIYFATPTASIISDAVEGRSKKPKKNKKLADDDSWNDFISHLHETAQIGLRRRTLIGAGLRL